MSEPPQDPAQVETMRAAGRVSRVTRPTSLRIRTLEESGHRVRVSFRQKIVLMFGLSLLIVGGLTFFGVRSRFRGVMLDDARAELTATRRVFESLIDAHFAHLESSARLIADAPKLRAAIETADPATVEEEVGWFRTTGQADLMAVVGADGKVLSFTTSAGRAKAPAKLPGVEDALKGTLARGLLDHDGRLYMTVAAAAGAERAVSGAVLVGYALKDAFAARVHSVTDVHVAFLVAGGLRATSLDPATFADVSSRVAMTDQSASGDIRLGRQHYLYLSGTFAPSAASLPLRYFLLQSLAPRESALSNIESTMVMGAAVFLVILLILSGHISERLTRGIQQLVDVAHQMARGNFEAPISVAPGDEIGYLAYTMQELRGSVAEQMRKLSRINENLRGKIEEILFNETLGAHYDHVEVLGRGGMGIVYRAHNTEEDRTVAIKVLSPMLAELPSVVTRFMREGQILARLSHPGLIRVYNVDQSKLPFCEMEYFAGPSLQHVVRDTGPIAWMRARPMIDRLLSALAYCHGAGVIHRDIKPSNILVGEGDEVRLIDFGLARDDSLTSLTHSMEAFGTPDYIAPEQERGQEVDERADVYSMGQTLFFMLTGTLVKMRQTGYVPLAERLVEGPDAPPPAVDRILARALEPDREGRFESMEAMRRAFAEL
jgi:HAMP domain-containing protein